ncbi:MAG: trehalose-phosphatase [Chloroflexi bacterium]|nr:trehalose-phosphatase [Chloroflexota bacterium]
MEYLFDAWASFEADVRAAEHVLLLSDFDGTLAPIAPRPADAVMPPEVRDKLQSLSQKPHRSAGIISGRSLAEVRAMVGIEGVYYAGNHGLEIEGPDLNYVHPGAEASRKAMSELCRQLSAALGGVEGVIIEDKGLSLSVHYRLVAGDREAGVADAFDRTAAPWSSRGKVRITAGKKVWEIRPPIDWHKGKAVETLAAQIRSLTGHARLLTIYLGDDKTDEDAFSVLRRPHGWSIFIRDGGDSSSAEFFLRSPAEVSLFLSRLIEIS